MKLGRRSAALLAAATLILGGCSSTGDDAGESKSSAGSGKVTVEFWNIWTNEPLKSYGEEAIKRFQAQHPNITIKNVAITNDSFKPKLTTVTQSGKAPHIFQTWGGGVLKQQIDAGLVKDVSQEVAAVPFTQAALTAYQFDGKMYAFPYDIGMVGFWYNKALFKKAGITQPPGTWSEFIDAVKKLKAANITPLALAGKATWTGHYYWAYLVMRIGGLAALQQAGVDHNFTGPDFVAAGQRLKELADLQPFQKGWQNAAYDSSDGQAATMGNGKAAMELMGQWAPSVQSSAGKGIGDDLGFFPFPVVEGGKGALTESFGGGGGFAIGSDAPPEAVEFVKFLVQDAEHRKAVESGGVLPVLQGEEDAVKDPNLSVVAKTLASTTGFQLYLDQAYPPAVGQEVNDAVAQLIAGKMTPEQVGQAITETAKSE